MFPAIFIYIIVRKQKIQLTYVTNQTYLLIIYYKCVTSKAEI